MQMLNTPDDTSWWDELINGLTQKPVPSRTAWLNTYWDK